MAAIVLPLTASAQATRFRPPANYTAGGKADQAEGAKILGEFRQAGIPGIYWLEFELRVMPRKGPERTVRGHLFGARNAAGPVTRLTLNGAAGIESEQRWLIQSGRQPAAWQWTGLTAKTTPLSAAEAFTPVGGTDLTLFDLQMPFIFWEDFVYEGVAKVRGRPAHSFVLYPPADLSAARPELTGVRVLLDTQFQAMVQAELLGAKGTPEKSLSVLDLKKSGEQWIVKSIDLRNLVSRDKTRITFTAAAFGLALPELTFAADGLAEEAPALREAQIQHF